MAIWNWIKGKKQQAQKILPVQVVSLESLEPRLLLSADLTSAYVLDPLDPLRSVDNQQAIYMDVQSGSTAITQTAVSLDAGGRDASSVETGVLEVLPAHVVERLGAIGRAHAVDLHDDEAKLGDSVLANLQPERLGRIGALGTGVDFLDDGVFVIRVIG